MEYSEELLGGGYLMTGEADSADPIARPVNTGEAITS